MAGPTVKEILLKWNIDNSNWKKAIQELSSLLEKSNKDADKAADKAASKLEAQKAKLKDLVAAQKTETAEIEKQIDKLKQKAAAAGAQKAEAAARLASEKAASAEAQKQTAIQKTLQAAQRTLQQEVTTKLANERLVTAEINRQNAALRLQATQQRAVGTGGAGRRPPTATTTTGGGSAGGFLSGVGTGLLGGLGGTIFAAVASADIFGEKLVELTKKMEEFIKETGPLQQVREQFEKLAITSGKDPAKFIGDLRTATHGLVDDMGLYRIANTFMQSGVKASQEDITKLTQATVGLARAQGRDAGAAVQALGRFFLTGRAVTLAYVTGIQRTQLQLQGLGHSTDSAARSTLQLKQAMEVITAQYQAIGEPALTFTDRMTQLGVAQHRFWEEIVLGLTKSKGFENFLEWIGSLAEKAGEMAEKAAGWGDSLGTVFTALIEAGKIVGSVFTAANSIVEGVFSLISSAFGSEAISSDFVNRLTTIKGLFITIAQTLIVLRSSMEEFGLRAEYTLKEAAVSAKEAWKWANTPIGGTGYDSAKVKSEQARLHAEFENRLSGTTTDAYKALDKLQGQLYGGQESKYQIQFAAPSKTYSAEQEEAAARKIAKAKEQIAIESAKIELEQTQMRIKKEEELVQVQYEQGLITIKQYLAQKASLELQDHNAKLVQLKQEHDAKIQYMDIESRETRDLAKLQKEQANIEAQTQLASIERQKTQISLQLQEDLAKGVITQPQAAQYGTQMNAQFEVQKGLIERSRSASNRQADAQTAELNAQRLVEEKKYLSDVLKENENYQQKGRQLTEQDIKDEIAARQKLSDEIQKIDKQRIDQSKEITESEFQQGTISARDYLASRVKFIEDEYTAVKDGADRRLAANKESDTARAEFAQKMSDAALTREKELTKLAIDQDSIRTRAVEESYDRAGKLLAGQIQLQTSTSTQGYFGGGKEEERTLIEQQITLLRSRLAEEVKGLEPLQKGTALWAQQEEKILTSQQALVKYNEELTKSYDLSSGVASAARELAQAASRFPRRGGGVVAGGLQTFATNIQESAAAGQRISQRQAAARARAEGKVAAPVTPEEIFASLQKSSATAGDEIKQHLETASAAVDDWKDKLVTAGQQFTDSIVQTTKALLALRDAASGKATGAAGTTAQPGGFWSKASGISGPATAAAPLGTVTESDKMALQPAGVTSAMQGSDHIASTSELAAAGLSLVAQSSNQVQGKFQNLITTTLGDSGLVGFFKNLGKNTQTASDDLSNFVDNISSLAGDIGGIQATLQGKGGPTQAGLQGLSSGGGLGSMIGGLFSSLSSMAGPIGQGIGAAVGLAVGIFSGKAEKAAQKLAKDIMAQFNAVLQGVQQGTVGLGSAVQQEISIINQAVDELSGKKGGRSLLNQMLPQMEQQLEQLQTQQQQVIKSFDATVEQISAPEAQQALVQPIQAIIKTYQEYILAGGNVATANQYLQSSFQNLVSQGLQTLNTAEQTAVNNALNYNNLLIQRQQLIQDTNQQIQNIMSQGVAVRQMPSGVTKAQQLEQVEVNAQTQLANLDQQIAVSQHQLTNEQKIFNLATTRVGLETQLVQLQDAQIDKQDASTTALLQEVAAFSQGVPTNLPTAMAQLGLSGQYISPTTEPGLAPIPPVKTGIQAIDEQNQLAYQQALAYYNSQAGLSPTATIASTAGNIPGGMQGITLSTGTGTPTAGLSSASTTLGGVLDQMASNITAFPQAMQAVFSNASTIVNVGGSLLTSIATALGAKTPSTMPGAPGAPITVNGQQVNTQPTVSGTALVVTPSPTTGQSQTTGSNPWGAGSTLAATPGILRTGRAPSPTDMVASALSTQSAHLTAHVSAATQRQTIEQNISSLSATRVQQETALVNLKMTEINADVNRLTLWQQVNRSGSGSGAQTLEDMLQNVYNSRARQGFGGFNGETNNAFI